MAKGLRLTEAEAAAMGIGQKEKEAAPKEPELTAAQMADWIQRSRKEGYLAGFKARDKGSTLVYILVTIGGFMAGFIFALMAVHKL